MRTELAAEIGRVRDGVADQVTEIFLSRHPDWIVRYGDQARVHGVQDARHHIDFLQAAVDLDDPVTFIDYVQWCRSVLGARGIDVSFLVENLETIRDELAGRMSSPAAAAAAISMRAGLDALVTSEDSPGPRGDPLSPACRLYLAASVSGRRADALAIVREALRGGESTFDVYIDIFQSALYEVGRRWETTGLTIAEEHMATATTQFILSVLHEELVHTRSPRGTVVVTGVVDEQHAVGASIIANALDADGWDVRYLGTNLPPDGIVSAIEKHQPSLVAMSVTMSSCVANAHDLIARIRESNAAVGRIIVGGRPFRADPQLWHSIGADGFGADVRSAVEVARA